MKLIKIVTLSMLAAITANQVYAAEPDEARIGVPEEQKELYKAYTLEVVGGVQEGLYNSTPERLRFLGKLGNLMNPKDGRKRRIILKRAAVGFAVPAVLYLASKNQLTPDDVKRIDYKNLPLEALELLLDRDINDLMKDELVGLPLDLANVDVEEFKSTNQYGRNKEVEFAVQIGEKWEALQTELRRAVEPGSNREKLSALLISLEAAVLKAAKPDVQQRKIQDLTQRLDTHRAALDGITIPAEATEATEAQLEALRTELYRIETGLEVVQKAEVDGTPGEETTGISNLEEQLKTMKAELERKGKEVQEAIEESKKRKDGKKKNEGEDKSDADKPETLPSANKSLDEITTEIGQLQTQVGAVKVEAGDSVNQLKQKLEGIERLLQSVEVKQEAVNAIENAEKKADLQGKLDTMKTDLERKQGEVAGAIKKAEKAKVVSEGQETLRQAKSALGAVGVTKLTEKTDIEAVITKLKKQKENLSRVTDLLKEDGNEEEKVLLKDAKTVLYQIEGKLGELETKEVTGSGSQQPLSQSLIPTTGGDDQGFAPGMSPAEQDLQQLRTSVTTKVQQVLKGKTTLRVDGKNVQVSKIIEFIPGKDLQGFNTCQDDDLPGALRLFVRNNTSKFK